MPLIRHDVTGWEPIEDQTATRAIPLGKARRPGARSIVIGEAKAPPHRVRKPTLVLGADGGAPGGLPRTADAPLYLPHHRIPGACLVQVVPPREGCRCRRADRCRPRRRAIGEDEMALSANWYSLVSSVIVERPAAGRSRRRDSSGRWIGRPVHHSTGEGCVRQETEADRSTARCREYELWMLNVGQRRIRKETTGRSIGWARRGCKRVHSQASGAAHSAKASCLAGVSVASSSGRSNALADI